MKFEVVEAPDAWILRRDGEEVARFRDQDQALADAAQRMRERAGEEASYAFAVRYLERG